MQERWLAQRFPVGMASRKYEDAPDSIARISSRISIARSAKGTTCGFLTLAPVFRRCQGIVHVLAAKVDLRPSGAAGLARSGRCQDEEFERAGADAGLGAQALNEGRNLRVGHGGEIIEVDAVAVLRSRLPSGLTSPSLFFSQPDHAAGLACVSFGPRAESNTLAMRPRRRDADCGVIVHSGSSTLKTSSGPISPTGKLRNHFGRSPSDLRHWARCFGFLPAVRRSSWRIRSASARLAEGHGLFRGLGAPHAAGIDLGRCIEELAPFSRSGARLGQRHARPCRLCRVRPHAAGRLKR